MSKYSYPVSLYFSKIPNWRNCHKWFQGDWSVNGKIFSNSVLEEENTSEKKHTLYSDSEIIMCLEKTSLFIMNLHQVTYQNLFWILICLPSIRSNFWCSTNDLDSPITSPALGSQSFVTPFHILPVPAIKVWSGPGLR